jgi:hypothetical protein
MVILRVSSWSRELGISSFLVLLKMTCTMETREIQSERYNTHKSISQTHVFFVLSKFGNHFLHLFQGRRPNKRIPSAHESRERLRYSEIFKRRLYDPVDEKQNKSDWD